MHLYTLPCLCLCPLPMLPEWSPKINKLVIIGPGITRFLLLFFYFVFINRCRVPIRLFKHESIYLSNISGLTQQVSMQLNEHDFVCVLPDFNHNR